MSVFFFFCSLFKKKRAHTVKLKILALCLSLSVHGAEYMFCGFCQLALFLLERSPPLRSHTATWAYLFSGIIAERQMESLGYVSLNHM